MLGEYEFYMYFEGGVEFEIHFQGLIGIVHRVLLFVVIGLNWIYWTESPKNKPFIMSFEIRRIMIPSSYAAHEEYVESAQDCKLSR